MTWDQEWAAARATATTMRINHADEGPGGASGGGADLTVHRDDLGAIGHDAFTLHGRLARDGDHARVTTFDASVALTNGNFTSGTQLMKVHDRWNKQLRTLLDACAHISDHLDYTKATHAANDADIAGKLTPISKINEYFK